MGKQFFRAEIQYNNNMGASDEDTLYILEDNSRDYMSVCTKDGCSVSLDGTDSYIEMLRHVLGLENYEGCGESVKIKELLNFPQDFEIPDKVIRTADSQTLQTRAGDVRQARGVGVEERFNDAELRRMVQSDAGWPATVGLGTIQNYLLKTTRQ